MLNLDETIEQCLGGQQDLCLLVDDLPVCELGDCPENDCMYLSHIAMYFERITPFGDLPQHKRCCNKGGIVEYK